MIRDFLKLPAFAGTSNDVNVIVDTPQGSLNKFKYDEESGLFMLGGAMPAGAMFLLSSASSPRRSAAMVTRLIY
jgi:inorganic pyrophosphatase